MYEPGETTMVVIRGFPGSIVGTNRHVYVDRPAGAIVWNFDQLTRADAQLSIFKRRVVLHGPGIPKGTLNALTIGMSTYATVVQIWRMGEARRGAAAITRLIETQGASTT
jgi:hypothetical protein